MTRIGETVKQAIVDIQNQQGYRTIPLENEHRVVKDLGFSSLDVAQLIAVLEFELGVDPFASGFSIMEVHTVAQLIHAYEATTGVSGP